MTYPKTSCSLFLPHPRRKSIPALQSAGAGGGMVSAILRHSSSYPDALVRSVVKARTLLWLCETGRKVPSLESEQDVVRV